MTYQGRQLDATIYPDRSIGITFKPTPRLSVDDLLALISELEYIITLHRKAHGHLIVD